MTESLRALIERTAHAAQAGPDPGKDPQAERIIGAAIDAIAVLGWKRLTMSDVAKRSHVGRATLYRYFSTKDELRDAIVLHEVRRFVTGSAAARAAATDTEEAMVAAIGFTLTFLEQNKLLRRLRETERDTLIEALSDDDVLVTGSALSAQMWKAHFHGDTTISADELQHLQTVGEIMARLVVSLAINPTTVIPLAHRDDARTFARRYLLPLIRGQS